MTLHNDTEHKKSAAILHFLRKRGRPRSAIRNHDTGTPELIMKRLRGETTEALYLCLQKGLISEEQHWCGIHLRWLYTLRHGIPGVRAIDPTHLGGMELKNDDPTWRVAREQEYHEAIRKVMAGGDVALLLAYCIYNERPTSLKSSSKSIEKLRESLDTLVAHWGRQRPAKR